jgi:hypothetical protein
MRLRSIVWLALAACGADPYDGPAEIGAPIGTRRSVAWVDQRTQEIVVAVPGKHALHTKRVAIGDDETRIAWATSDRSGEQVLALVVPESERIEDVENRLVRVAADGDGTLGEVPVRAPFSSIALGPDGRRVVLHFGNGPGTDVLQNANQVALVDLRDDTVRDLTLNGFGARVSSVQFPATDGLPVQIGSVQREIIAFLAEGELVLVDAADPDLDQVAVRFGGDVGFEPVATLMRPGNELFEHAALFLRSDVGTDLAMLTLVDQLDEAGQLQGFSAQVSLVPVGAGTSDFLLHDGEDVPYLVTVAGTTLSFIDIRTQQGFTVALEDNASRLTMRTEATTFGDVPQLVAWAPGAFEIHRLDLDGIADALGRRPETLRIETGIDDLVRLDNDRVLVGSGDTLYVVDFTRSQVTPLTSAVPYDARSSAVSGDRLLLGTPGQSWVSAVDLQTLDPESMVLDEPIAGFFHLAGPGKLAIVHDDSAGLVTIADANAPSRATSYATWGIFIEHLLERRR